jgi:hypothetical protein
MSGRKINVATYPTNALLIFPSGRLVTTRNDASASLSDEDYSMFLHVASLVKASANLFSGQMTAATFDQVAKQLDKSVVAEAEKWLGEGVLPISTTATSSASSSSSVSSLSVSVVRPDPLAKLVGLATALAVLDEDIYPSSGPVSILLPYPNRLLSLLSSANSPGKPGMIRLTKPTAVYGQGYILESNHATLGLPVLEERDLEGPYHQLFAAALNDNDEPFIRDVLTVTLHANHKNAILASSFLKNLLNLIEGRDEDANYALSKMMDSLPLCRIFLKSTTVSKQTFEETLWLAVREYVASMDFNRDSSAGLVSNRQLCGVYYPKTLLVVPTATLRKDGTYRDLTNKQLGLNDRDFKETVEQKKELDASEAFISSQQQASTSSNSFATSSFWDNNAVSMSASTSSSSSVTPSASAFTFPPMALLPSSTTNFGSLRTKAGDLQFPDYLVVAHAGLQAKHVSVASVAHSNHVDPKEVAYTSHLRALAIISLLERRSKGEISKRLATNCLKSAANDSIVESLVKWRQVNDYEFVDTAFSEYDDSAERTAVQQLVASVLSEDKKTEKLSVEVFDSERIRTWKSVSAAVYMQGRDEKNRANQDVYLSAIPIRREYYQVIPVSIGDDQRPLFTHYFTIATDAPAVDSLYAKNYFRVILNVVKYVVKGLTNKARDTMINSAKIMNGKSMKSLTIQATKTSDLLLIALLDYYRFTDHKSNRIDYSPLQGVFHPRAVVCIQTELVSEDTGEIDVSLAKTS